MRAVVMMGAVCALTLSINVGSANAVPQPCPNGAICFYDGSNGTGFKVGAWQGDAGLPWFGYLNFNDRTDSIINNTQWTWNWYPHVNYSGSPRAVPPRHNIAQNLPYINVLSSAKQCYCV